MQPTYPRLLAQLAQHPNRHNLLSMQRGLEKEGLRVNPNGELAESGHPKALGASLTHPSITTDFAESMLELVTDVAITPDAAIASLEELHQAALSQLPAGETLWNSSMPARLGNDEQIQPAWFGHNNAGYQKHLYRQGLARRYGNKMQTIAGIHYNLSLSDEFWQWQQRLIGHGTAAASERQSNGYMGLIRQFRRLAWLLSYLFGASPAVDRSFFGAAVPAQLQQLDLDTFYLPWATSLRMSDLGYSSNAQTALAVHFNSLDEYIDTIAAGLQTPYPTYQQFDNQDGTALTQLNSNLLQIENEFYSIIRPKRVAEKGESQLLAMARRGVQYIEVRNLDINPLLPLGIDAQQAHFIELFLLYCALQPSPQIDAVQHQRNLDNFALSVQQGRKPGLLLQDGDRRKTLTDWATELLQQMLPLAELLDEVHGTDAYRNSWQAQLDKCQDVSLTPSAQLLAKLQSGQSYLALTHDLSKQHAATLTALPLTPERQRHYQQLATESLRQFEQLETQRQIPFSEHLAQLQQRHQQLLKRHISAA
ncbi:glutamate--cysteine ligase [Ferrimonas senticii]|uniref:glutamate--cysteine ligase n=1 Tax=Ferrimonas senticii TaxID=394566 RepID=UPI00146A9513|nr:glutamate--cysteine ligase [Ferrimonas senticii]